MRKAVPWMFATVMLMLAALTAVKIALVFAVEIRIPVMAVSIMTGAVTFVLIGFLLLVVGGFLQDLIFYRSCRETYGEILLYEWRDWRCLVPSVLAGGASGFLLTPWAIVPVAVSILWFITIGIYVYTREMVMAEIGDLFYRH